MARSSRVWSSLSPSGRSRSGSWSSPTWSRRSAPSRSRISRRRSGTPGVSGQIKVVIRESLRAVDYTANNDRGSVGAAANRDQQKPCKSCWGRLATSEIFLPQISEVAAVLMCLKFRRGAGWRLQISTEFGSRRWYVRRVRRGADWRLRNLSAAPCATPKHAERASPDAAWAPEPGRIPRSNP